MELVHLVFLFSSLLASVCLAVPANSRKRVIDFDNGNYQVLFEVRPPLIDFFLAVKTTGWVALGISHSPNKTQSDLVIGGFKNDQDGSHYYNDYHINKHTVGNSEPIKDTENNWLFDSKESRQSGIYTLLHFSRLLQTADKEQDVEILDKEMYLLWGYGETDDSKYLDGKSRHGSQLINLMSDPISKAVTETSLDFDPSEEPIDFNCPSPDGNFPDPEDCTGFYACADGVAVGHHFCPDGLYFNPVINNCDYPWNVDCHLSTPWH